MYAFMKASQPVLQSLAVHPSAGTGRYRVCLPLYTNLTC